MTIPQQFPDFPSSILTYLLKIQADANKDPSRHATDTAFLST